MSNNQKQRSATERLNDLEQATMNLYQTVDNMARDLMTVKDAIKLLGNKVDSIVQAIQAGGPVNDDVIGALMVQNNVNELKTKVDGLIAQGVLVAEAAITAESFVVGREISAAGKVTNPRIQFVMTALSPEIKEKLVGVAPGQTVEFQEGKDKFEVVESFSIQNPQLPTPEAVEAAEAAAPAPEASEAASS